MRRILSFLLFLFVSTSFAIGQTGTVVTGKVSIAKGTEGISAVSVLIKGTSSGTFTDDKGNFNFTTNQKPPFTLVFSSVGYANKEVTYNGSSLSVELEAAYTVGTEVTVSASRVSERILESPVSIERIGTAAIRNAPAANYYDMLTNLKGVDVVSASLTFRSVGTRGFNSSGNLRLNQIVDGMDNQAPGLNFSVGNIVGLTELDVESMELLPGASSALYGPGGMNGTVIINPKDPFKYQGLSFQIKGGANHVDDRQRIMSPFWDWSVRYAKKIGDKWAYKIGAQMVTAQDWLGTDTRNYATPLNTPRERGSLTGGDRMTDPNYDGVNMYGDETTTNMSGVASTIRSAIAATLGPLAGPVLGASDSWLAGTAAAWNAGSAAANLTAYNTFLTGIGAGALVMSGQTPILFGAAPSRNFFNNQSVSRTGYNESQIINPTTVNVKLTGALYYKINDKITASFSAYYGTGNTVYTGSDRYSLKELRMGQYKLELKHKNWFVRAYTTQEDAGQSYNATITTRLFNEAWKASSTWYPQYMAAYATARGAGLNLVPNMTAHNNARAFADQGRPTGDIQYNPLFQKIATTPISQNGGLFLDKSSLNMLEGQWNLSTLLGLDKMKTDILIGGNYKQYVLNSEGTLFADKVGEPIKINELGGYLQITQKLFNDKLKLVGSARYDKQTSFAGRFTPRVAAVYEVVKDNNVRVSYQQAYRFPSTQNQWINLAVGGGTQKLIGGLPELRDINNFNTRPAYTPASAAAFGAAWAASVIAQGGNPNAATTAQALTALAAASPSLRQQVFEPFKPERMTSIEIGYKGVIAKKLLIDAYFYNGVYNDFIGTINAVQSKTSTALGLLNRDSIVGYSISTNLKQEVKTNGWGLSLEYQFPNNYFVSGNLYSDKIGDLPADFVSFFNTPDLRGNFSIGNTGFLTDNRYGFSLVVRAQREFFYQGTFGTATLPQFSTWDAMVSYKLPKIRSLLKLGGTNIGNRYFRTGFGSPAQGGLYYVSFAYNVF